MQKYAQHRKDPILPMENLFETLWKRIGCTYMSDIRHSPYRELAADLLKEMDLSAHTRQEVADLCQYLSIDPATLGVKK